VWAVIAVTDLLISRLPVSEIGARRSKTEFSPAKFPLAKQQVEQVPLAFS
jgi:hypothetical protein